MKLILLSFLIATNSFAGDKWEELNKVFNPKVENEVGYNIEYRVDNNNVWINITSIKKVCNASTTTFLKNNQLVKITKHTCANKLTIYDSGSYLLVIICRAKFNVCKKRLNQEVNEKIIREMIVNNEEYVVIE